MTAFLDGPGPLPDDGRPVVATVGTFDGVHRGHRKVLDELTSRAAAVGGRSVLATFDPHPLQVVRPRQAPLLLTTLEEKKAELAKTRLDVAAILPFTDALRRTSPGRFVGEVLLDGLGAAELIVGYDHGFGRGRSGDASTLRAIARERGFAVSVVAPVDSGDGAVSSSAIRRALLEGRLEEANRGLGRRYALSGTVVRGDGRGRLLGFPTANVEVLGDRKLIPAAGIYSCFADVLGNRFMGAMHIGPRPTFPGAAAAVEAHLLDLDRDVDLYGRAIRVEMVAFLRPVLAFADAEALARRMRADVRLARRSLEAAAEREASAPRGASAAAARPPPVA